MSLNSVVVFFPPQMENESTLFFFVSFLRGFLSLFSSIMPCGPGDQIA